jgi:hypothetical protein
MPERREFTITRMRVDAAGVLRAFVSINGGPTVAVDREFGSWQTDVRPFPGARFTIRRTVLQEIATALQAKARRLEKSVPCPTCRAGRGRVCEGTPSHVVHPARLDALGQPQHDELSNDAALAAVTR